MQEILTLLDTLKSEWAELYSEVHSSGTAYEKWSALYLDNRVEDTGFAKSHTGLSQAMENLNTTLGKAVGEMRVAPTIFYDDITKWQEALEKMVKINDRYKPSEQNGTLFYYALKEYLRAKTIEDKSGHTVFVTGDADEVGQALFTLSTNMAFKEALMKQIPPCQSCK